MQLAAPAAPMAMSESGKVAVVAAKKASKLRESIAMDKDEEGSGVKSVEDKTFYYRGGFWTDSDFDGSKLKPEEIQFGSSRYFDLVSKNPELRKYLAVSTQVVVVYKGHAYKIVAPKNATT
jgi:hypothetical protein